MSVSTYVTDSHKEYFFKINKNGAKMFYRRTDIGYRRIAKTEIPKEFIELICEHDKKDTDWLRSKHDTLKDIAKWQEELKYYEKFHESPMRTKSIRVLNDRITSALSYIQMTEEMFNDAREKRYKEETKAYGGFEGFFKEKYKEYTPSPVTQLTYDTLISCDIIKNKDTPKDEAKKKYRRWLVENHPDKGGDNEVCARVISEYKQFIN